MDDRTKRYIEYGIGVLIIVLLVVLILMLRKPKEVPDGPVPPQDVRDMPTAEEVFSAEEITQARPAPEVNARVFAERFGSFSSESEYGNVADVLPLASPELQSRLRDLQRAAQQELTEEYYGISTRVVGLTRTSEEEGKVSFTVLTQREEATGNPGNKQIRNQNMTLTMQLMGEQWLVADYAWVE